MSNQFFPEGMRFNSYPDKQRVNTLADAIKAMPPSAKMAMYAAGSEKLIKRGTWNGCAWNAAGQHVGKTVQSYASAAKAFKCSQDVVSNFIRIWDNMKGDDVKCNEILMSALDEVGLNTVPEDFVTDDEGNKVRIISGYAYKSLDTKFQEELANVDSLADMPGFDDTHVEATKVLLSV